MCSVHSHTPIQHDSHLIRQFENQHYWLSKSGRNITNLVTTGMCTSRAQWLGSKTPDGRSNGNLGYFVQPTLSVSFEETLKAVGPSDLVSMPGKVKYPTLGANVTCR